MGTQNRIRIANDNSPVMESDYKASVNESFFGVISKDVSPPSKLPIPDTTKVTVAAKTNNVAHRNEPKHSLKLTISCWIAACIMITAAFMLDLGTAPKVFASLSLLWLGLWNSYVSADYGHWRLSEISVVTALTGLLGAVLSTLNYFGLNLTLGDGLLLMSTVPIGAAYILKSRICVLASICGSLIWAILSFTELAATSPIIMVVPVIFAAQLFLATTLRSGIAISLAVMTAYYWLFSFIFTHWRADDLPLTFATAGLLTIGIAHHRSGKALEDKRITGSSIHIYAGWLTAMIGAIGFQYFWLTPEAAQNSTATLSVTGLSIWKAVIVLAVAAVFGSAVIRYKHAQISFAGIILVTAASALVPMMLWFPAWPQSIIAAIPGLSAMPSIGIFIGGTVIAMALGMTLNGVRRHSPLMMAMGISALLIEFYMLMTPEFLTLDNSVVFIAGLLSALAFGAAIAGLSLTHQAPAPRLKYS